MGWKTRGNRRYFQQNVRVDGKPRTLYWGSGPEAQAAADAAEARKQERARRQALVRALRQIDADLQQADNAARPQIEAAATAAGFHYQNRRWSKKRSVQ
ncbi:hypothetical protein Pla175_30270 [Pirellulimonas nuda]|uniref:Uncharacterized protein n=1 Tax=Pirellulimonas nuda TaxID=2528009 RepID=A0A518DCD6_9BACT|nr:hypothetical protein [Pirellulimonas nuda]QDU89144.1 hypothetical protein Pla175_25310 [Pirellulimonas nuda]QDU89634.1 hypothetical protein Pla175_30270 [Pirellulimonas nuda]